MADGRAVLRSSIREFICSEAMFHLGVPTTRALSLVGSGQKVVRDMFYKYGLSLFYLLNQPHAALNLKTGSAVCLETGFVVVQC